MEIQQVMEMMQSEGGMKKMMQKPAFENQATGHEFSQADLIADVVNILRMDTKRMAEAHDMDMEISKMTPERAAELLQGVAKGEDLGLIDVFDEIEDQRMLILKEIEGEEPLVEYAQMKQQMLYTVPDGAELEDGDEVQT